MRGRCRDLLALAPLARREHLLASVAASDALTGRDVAMLRRAGLDPIAELKAGGMTPWFEAGDQLRPQVASYQLRGSFYYLAPREGFTISDYLLARHLGGKPLQAGYQLGADSSELGRLHPGEVVVATLGPDRRYRPAQLLKSVRRLERIGLAVSSVQRLASEQRPR